MFFKKYAYFACYTAKFVFLSYKLIFISSKTILKMDYI